MTRIATALVLLSLAACADDPPRQIVWATTKPIVGPDGSRAWVVECRTSINYCYEVAGKQCPRGYDVIDRGGQTGAIATTETDVRRTSPHTAAGHEQTTVTPTFRGSMLVKCKAPPTPVAPVEPPSSAPAASSSGSIVRESPL